MQPAATLGALFAPFFAATLAAGLASAQPYPSKPIRIVIPFSAGGPADITVRNVAPRMTEVLNAPSIIVDNRAGGNGFIGAEIVAKAPPDGYTLLAATATITSINMVVFPNRPYDTLRDLQPLTPLMQTDTILVAHPSLPVRGLKELVALAKSRPGQVVMGSGGNGSTLHLVLELLNTEAGIKTNHVPYKGAAPAVTDLIAGQINAMFVDLPVISPHLKGGKVRPLAVASAKRSAYFPDVPTTVESGYPNVLMSGLYSLLLPIKTPRDIVMKLHDAALKTMATPAVREKFTSFAADPYTMSPEDFTAFLRTDIEKWAKVAKAANIRVD